MPTSPESAATAVVRQLEELDGIAASHTVSPYSGVTLTVTLPELTEERLLEVAGIARAGLSQDDRGFRSRLEVYSGDDLVFEADGLKPMDEQLRGDIHYLFAVTEAAGVPFRLRSAESFPLAPASRTIESITTEYSSALDWAAVAALDDPTGNEWSVWRGPGMFVTGSIPSAFVEALPGFAEVGPISYDLFDEPGGIRLSVGDSLTPFVSVGDLEVGRVMSGELRYDQTTNWPLVLAALAVSRGLDANFQYFDIANGGGPIIHFGACDFVWSDGDAVNNDAFLTSLVESGAQLPDGTASGECGKEE